MPRVHHVKSARKENPVAKVGESYYWWKFRFGGKRYSKTYPRPSQLTQSEFLGALYDLQERIGSMTPANYEDPSDLQSEVQELIDEIVTLGDEQDDKRQNMPYQLQDADSGMMLEERYQACHDWAADLEAIDLEFDEDTYADGEYTEWLEAVISEIQSCEYPGEG